MRAMIGTSKRPRAQVLRLALPSLTLLLASTACEVQWGGGRLALEDPSPPEAEPAADEGEPAPAPLPEAPLLYLVRLGSAGQGHLAAIARIASDSLAALEFPTPIPEEFRERFEQAFLPAGRELALVVGGKRVGSVVVGDPTSDRANCLSVASVQAILPPGSPVPEIGFAVPLELSPVRVGRAPERAPSNRMVTFGPVLAEQLLRAEGVARPFLAQRTALDAVAGSDSLMEMAATYLINDSLAPGPPRGDAASLFFLARREPTRGYLPVWREVRTYGTAERKEAFAYLEWLELNGSRFDFVKTVRGSNEGLSASRAPEDWRSRLSLTERTFVWTEPAECPILEMLSEATSG
jgi:hypothetical protein